MPFTNFLTESIDFLISNIDSVKKFDIMWDGKSSKSGWKLSIVGKNKNDLIDLIERLHPFLLQRNIAHKVATLKRINNPHKEQSKKLITIYVPDDLNHLKLAAKIEPLLHGYKGWHNIKTLNGYEHYSNAIFFRNDRDDKGNYISVM